MARDRVALRTVQYRLPEGERLLWQGSPDARALALHAFLMRLVGLYFGALLVLSAVIAVRHGAGLHALSLALLHRAALAAVPLALIALYAWAVSASTVYSITSRRVILRCGIALPITFNVPFARIDGVGLRLHAGGAGDISLSLGAGGKLPYFALWPHARPWRLARSEPMLRCVRDAGDASRILAQALAEHAAGEAAPVRREVRVPARTGQRDAALAM